MGQTALWTPGPSLWALQGGSEMGRRALSPGFGLLCFSPKTKSQLGRTASSSGMVRTAGGPAPPARTVSPPTALLMLSLPTSSAGVPGHGGHAEHRAGLVEQSPEVRPCPWGQRPAGHLRHPHPHSGRLPAIQLQVSSCGFTFQTILVLPGITESI